MSNTQQLQVGQKVASIYDGKVSKIYTVTRVTEKFAFLRVSDTSEIKLYREVKGDWIREFTTDKWSRTHYEISTLAHVKEYTLRVMRAGLQKINWSEVPDEVVVQIYKTVYKNPSAQK